MNESNIDGPRFVVYIACKCIFSFYLHYSVITVPAVIDEKYRQQTYTLITGHSVKSINTCTV